MYDCKYFGDCSAPMCPKDGNVEKTAWFPDEPICRLVDVPGWVKRQRKIAKKAVGCEAGCFTLPMLERDCRISQGIKGIDPDCTDVELKTAEKKWLEKHPVLKPISEELREKMRIQGEKNKALLTYARRKKTGLRHREEDSPDQKP